MADLLELVLDKLSPPLVTLLNDFMDLEQNVNELRRTLTLVQHALEDAEELEASSDVLLKDLKDVASNALYLLLDHNYYCSIYNNIQNPKKIRKVLAELQAAADKVVALNLSERPRLAAVRREWISGQETSSFVKESEILGREDDKVNIVNRLVTASDLAAQAGGEATCCVCVTIRGVTGIGKTTVAQLVYKDEEVKTHFDFKKWIFVSQDFDPKRILVEVIESVSRDKPCKRNSSLDALHSEVECLLRDKKYLIVLDDVWTDNQSDLVKLEPLFQGGVAGSRILVTTQSKKVAVMLNSSAYELNGLSERDCWYLFRRRAFQRGEEEKYPSLWRIGQQIAKKCGGVPLFATTLGSVLRCKRTETEWLYIRDNEIWNLVERESAVIPPAMRLSYSRLPRQLRRCFAFCSIFPRGYEIKKEKLTHMWMAEGLIIQDDQKFKAPEDIANDYFEDLLWMSFLEEAKHENGVITGYKMHDVAYNLARFVAKSDSAILSGDVPAPKYLEKMRRSSIVSDFNSSAIPPGIYQAKGLFTLLLFSGGKLKLDWEKLCSSFKYLHILDLSRCEHEGSYKASLSKLNHLNYLDLSYTRIKELPDGIYLENLQTLNLFYCRDLISLPLDKMKRLRHLNNTGCEALTTMHSCENKNPVFGLKGFAFIKRKRNLKGFERCPELQRLSVFVVGHSSEIQFLGSLNNLLGSLKITRLKNVCDAEDAKSVQLMGKKKLESLGLYWGNDDRRSNINPEEESDLTKYQERKISQPSRPSDTQEPEPNAPSIGEEVLEHLEPPEGLKRLLIQGYPGIKFPSWRFPCSLNVLHLIGCRRSEHLPVLGSLQFLNTLLLQEMHGVKYIGKEFYGEGVGFRPFPTLRELKLIDFPNLEEWSGPDGAEAAFPNCSKLIVSDCPKLIEVPVPVSVQHLELRRCAATVVHSFQDLTTLKSLVIEGIKDLLHFQRLFPGKNPLLTSLEIRSCSQLSELPPELENLSRLKSLTIQCCEDLSCFPRGFQNLIALEFLEIIECPNLTSFPNVKSGGLINLKTLSIENCHKLTSLPRGLQHLTSLESLTIMYCPCIGTFPERTVEHLSKLRRLSIIGCESLRSLPDGLQNLNSLLSLEIRSCPGLQALPVRMEKLVSLRSLAISGCENITSLPEGIKSLTALQHLSIQDCPQLLERCRQPGRADWRKISHVRHKQIGPPE